LEGCDTVHKYLDNNRVMLLGFQTELKLNNQQKTLLAEHSGVARHAWNWGSGRSKNEISILDLSKIV
jgi:putative transposase